MKPRILITARECMNGDNPAWQVNKAYTEAIIKAGGIPVICPPQALEQLEIIGDLCEGMLVTGGDDLEPSLYNQPKHPTTVCADYALDKMDMELISYFYKFRKPILGICRGIQSINVAFGGTLYQDLPSEYVPMREDGHSKTEHLVYFEKGTYGEQVFGKVFMVNSYHHQAIKALGNGLTVSGVSEDGIIEAVEGRDLFAVQWHPEKLVDVEEHMRLFVDFIDMCKERM
ncbi:MAG: gamma-glutamyl-gamma-aminobutyrate hydrolase family protein [Erysipelotrichales bacterium]|nr:gamma-glutamyl-gamma-aminobutyrate hydrolase family protein [Erysipelotrichales bacterium]